MKVLIIDDEQDMRMIIRYALTHQGDLEVVEAESGAEGLRKAEEENPDVILMDLYMSVMDGTMALAELKRNPSTAAIPVIFVTAAANSKEIARLKSLGAVGVIAKPFDPGTLSDRVQAILNEK
jgi:two-component system, OmpR family, response regulator